MLQRFFFKYDCVINITIYERTERDLESCTAYKNNF